MKNSIVRKTLIGLIALASASAAVQSSAEGNWYVGGAVSQAFVASF